MEAASLIWFAVGATLLAVVTRVLVPPAAWLMLTALLHASRSTPPIVGTLLLWLAVYAGLAFGNRGILPASGAVYFAIVVDYATTFALPFVCDRLLADHVAPPLRTLIFPLAFVAVEFLRSRLSPAATWGSLAYTQYGELPLMQVAAFAGLWGITFLMAWSASTFDWALGQRFDWAIVRTPVIACAGVLGAALLGGTLRLVWAPTDRPSFRAAMLNRPVDLFAPGEMTRIAEGRVAPDERGPVAEKLARLHDWFLEGSRREAHAGARLVAWPETNLLIFKEDESSFIERARQLAMLEHVYLAIGMGTVHLGDPLPLENKLVLIDAHGKVAISYRKSHAVIGWEAGIMKRGDGRLPVVATDDGRIGGAVCFDADFPEFIRQAGMAAADLLVVPSNDWRELKALHGQMAVFRAIENGFSLVRPASSGISRAADPWGRELGVADYFAPGDRTLTVQVPIGGIRTIYARAGDWFAWLCVAALALAAGQFMLVWLVHWSPATLFG